MAEIPFEPYTGQSKLRFWCQKVLPLVYDDSLSYYEVLDKVVKYLNNTIADVSACEDNITALRDAFVQLQDYVNEQLEDFAPEVERIIDEMIDSGEFGDIIANVVNGLIAGEYSTTQGYAQFDYVLKDGKLYCATASTSGDWDATKWRETTVGADMQLLNQRVYNLNAGQVAFNESTTYDNNTVGKKLKDLDDFDDNLNAGQVAYDNNATYNSNTIGYKINNLNNAGENTLDDCNNFILGIKKVGPTTLNMPENAYGFIESYIAQNNSWKWQLLITTQTPQKIFKRANINNTDWTEWVRIVDNTDIDNLNAGQVAFNSENTYKNATVGKELQELKGSLNTVEQNIESLESIQITPVTVTAPSQFNLDSGNMPKVYRSGGLGILTIVAWTNQAIPAGSTSYTFSITGVNIIPLQTKTISGEFDITISTGSTNDVNIRALQGISNGYRVIITLPVYYN